MFDFEKLTVYQKSREFNNEVRVLLQEVKIDKVRSNQLSRASLSIMLNIAEGTGRFTKPDRRNFYTIARGSVFECVAILDCLKDQKEIPEEKIHGLYADLEQISKVLFALIRQLI